jgi:SsrA-binding protein
MSKEKAPRPQEIRNRKAGYEYEFLEKFVAGLMLMGTEVKSLRAGKAQISEAFCAFTHNELFVRDMHISEYTQGSWTNHEVRRHRKLLLSKEELIQIKKRISEKGLTLIPLRIFFNDRGLAKMEIALAKGKKIHDKRDSIKEKDVQREMNRLNA